MNQLICKDDFRYILSQPLPWNKFANKTILVTGANGFIPSYIVDTLLYFNSKSSEKIYIIGLARNKEKAKERFGKYKKRENLKIIIQDISDPIQIKDQVHFVIHAASQASPKYYHTDPVGTLKANVLGTYNLLEFSRNQPIEGFLFISAGEIYGNLQNKAVTTENDYGYVDPTQVRSCYAESKRIGETMCVCWHHQYDVPTKIVRLYHTYGPGIKLDDGRVFADFVANILQNQDIIVKSDGEAVRSFTYIADVIAGFFTVLLKGEKAQAYNLANEDATVSIKELANILIRLFPEKKLRVVFKQRPKNDVYLESKIKVNQPDTRKISSLGWKPQFSLKEGFLRTVQSFM